MPALNDLRQTGTLELLARQLVEGFITGLHKSPYHGFSVEFAEHRLYNEGQSTRYIDWKVYARTDRLYTKQYEEETNLRCLLVVDGSPSMYYPKDSLAKLRFSVQAAGALAYLLHKQRDAVGVCWFSDKIEDYTPIKSAATHLDKIFKILENRVQQGAQHLRPTNVAAVLHEIAEKTHRRSLVILFSDMFDQAENADELFKALQHLKHNRHEVLLFHVTDHETEMNFNFTDRPHEFIDLESGERLKLNPVEIRDKFVTELSAFHQSLKLRCTQLKIDFIPVNAREDYVAVLQSYLIKRARMK